MARPLLEPTDCLEVQLFCRVLSEAERPDGIGFLLETEGLVPPLAIVQLFGNGMLGQWEVRSRTPCCFSSLRMEHRGAGFYEVCRECGQSVNFNPVFPSHPQYPMGPWLRQLLPPHWDMLQQDLYLYDLHIRIAKAISLTALALQPLEAALQQPHRIHFIEMYRRYEHGIRTELEAKAQLINGTVLWD